jgi:hypothetical protein
MKKVIDGSKTAGQEMKEKQSQMDQAVNKSKEESQDLSRQEEERARNRRDGSEKRAGKSARD